MVAGLNMLSFDLFGLGRRKETDNASDKGRHDATERQTADREEKTEEPSDREIFFWALSPVI